MELRVTKSLLIVSCYLLWMASLPCVADRLPEPTPDALKLVQGLHATRMGIDRFGNLWSWSQSSGAVQAVSPAGSLVSSIRIEEGIAVDFDPQWGLAGILRGGRRLIVDPTSDSPDVEISLDEQMADVAWIVEGKVAVSPVRAPYRVEIWDVAGHRKIATWGEEERILSRPGTVRLNQFLLEYDFQRRLLYSLESFSGRIEVFDDDGRSVMRYRVPDRDQEALAKWLRDTDEENRAKGEVHEVTLSQWPGFAISLEGDIWLHEKCAVNGNRLELTRLAVTLDGRLQRSTLNAGSSDCCSFTSVLWGDWLILYREPSSHKEACVLVRRIGNEQ